MTTETEAVHVFDDDGLYTASQVAETFGMSPDTVLNNARDGEIRSIKIGRNVRFLGRHLNEDLTAAVRGHRSDRG